MGQQIFHKQCICEISKPSIHGSKDMRGLKSVMYGRTDENVPSDICTQRRHNSASASAQSDQSLRSPHEVTLHNAPITKTRLYNYNPLQPHFYTVKLFTGVYIMFLILKKKKNKKKTKKHRLWVLVRTALTNLTEPTIYVLSRNLKNIIIVYLKFSLFIWL